MTLHDVGGEWKSFLLYMSTFGPHCSETPQCTPLIVLNGGDLNAGKKSFQLGIRPMFTGRASPAYRMRRSASPDDDTMSYWPPPPFFISATISSELPAYFAFTWQPVCFSNGLTQIWFR